MTETEARRIAGEWHNGQWCPMYAFSSTGTVEEMLPTAIRRELRETDSKELRGLLNYILDLGIFEE